MPNSTFKLTGSGLVKSAFIADLIAEETGVGVFLRGVGNQIISDGASLVRRDVEDHPPDAVMAKPKTDTSIS